MTAAEKKLPVRPTVTSFCDRCHTLTKVTQYRTGGGKVEWLCSDSCAPNARQMLTDVVRNSPPPIDAVPSPAIDQWSEPVEPPDLHSDFPAELLDLEIDQAILDEDLARESEPIGAEQRAVADEDR